MESIGVRFRAGCMFSQSAYNNSGQLTRPRCCILTACIVSTYLREEASNAYDQWHPSLIRLDLVARMHEIYSFLQTFCYPSYYQIMFVY